MYQKPKKIHDQRNIWLCVLTEQNFNIVKKTKIYGVPISPRATREIIKARPGDILVFYLKSPVKAIVGLYEVSSRMFESAEMAPWADRLYPYRVRIAHKKECYVPYDKFIKPTISMGASMIPMTEEELREIMSLCGSFQSK